MTTTSFGGALDEVRRLIADSVTALADPNLTPSEHIVAHSQITQRAMAIALADIAESLRVLAGRTK